MQNQRLQNVKLDNHSYEFINKQIEEGKYSSASEVLIDSLKLLEAQAENQKKLEALRKALEDGENSGDSGPLDAKEILKEAHKRAGLHV